MERERGITITSGKLSTAEKLMKAIIDLVAEYGFNGVTTKEIAATAGVNEVTLFRHFGNKLNLLEQAFHRYHYADEMQKLFEDKIVYELYDDLLLVSRKYHELMNTNRKVMQIALKEKHVFKQFKEPSHKHPQKLKELLIEYFNEMRTKGKLVECNVEVQALSFLWMNYGAFVSVLDAGRMSYTESTLDQFIEGSVRTLTRGLTP
ncbi:TetR/AcrR family transcriptional regulator [Paenibacillus sp. GCM10027627]